MQQCFSYATEKHNRETRTRAAQRASAAARYLERTLNLVAQHALAQANCSACVALSEPELKES